MGLFSGVRLYRISHVVLWWCIGHPSEVPEWFFWSEKEAEQKRNLFGSEEWRLVFCLEEKKLEKYHYH
eukprot:g34273.t1